MQSFGQVIPVLGTNIGYPGNVSRIGDRVIAARIVLAASILNLNFGDGAIEVSSATGGSFQSLQDFLATPANAATLAQKFAGVAVRSVKTQLQYASLLQTGNVTVAVTTATATSGTSSLTVASATGISVGQSVEGAGVQPNTVVISVSGTTIGISLPVTAALSTTAVSFTSSIASVSGYYAPGAMAEVLERGSITVNITTGTPQANQPVYVRTVANASLGGTFVGGFEAAADLATSSITITTTLGSTALTTSAGTGLAIGQSVTGAGLAANTFITAGSGTSWTISQPAVAAVTTGAASFFNTALLGSTVDPWLVFRTGALDANGVAEITIKTRHAA